jgi:hypothetical protein
VGAWPVKGRPKPIFAPRAVVEAAARLGVEGILENEIERAILAGRKRGAGDLASVWLEKVDVVLARCRSPLGKSAWKVISVKPRRRR